MGTLTVDIESSISDAIDQSINETFEMMIGQVLNHLDTVRLEHAVPELEESEAGREFVTVVVGLSGGLQGSVSVCLSKEAAMLWTTKLIDHETDTLDQTVIDAIGELGNMVVGGAKGRLEDFNLTLGLPSVMLAGPSRLAFPSSCTPTQINLSVEDHDIHVYIALERSNL